MEATAKVTGVRITPRKAKLVVDIVRGKDVNVALGILANTNKSAVVTVEKLIKSAAANAVNNFKMNESWTGLCGTERPFHDKTERKGILVDHSRSGCRKVKNGVLQERKETGCSYEDYFCQTSRDEQEMVYHRCRR